MMVGCCRGDLVVSDSLDSHAPYSLFYKLLEHFAALSLSRKLATVSLSPSLTHTHTVDTTPGKHLPRNDGGVLPRRPGGVGHERSPRPARGRGRAAVVARPAYGGAFHAAYIHTHIYMSIYIYTFIYL